MIGIAQYLIKPAPTATTTPTATATATATATTSTAATAPKPVTQTTQPTTQPSAQTNYFMGSDGTMYKTVNGVTAQLTEKEMNPSGRTQSYQISSSPAPSPTPTPSSTLTTTAVNNQLVGGNTSSPAPASYYDVDTALNAVYSQAQKAGISIIKPTTYGSKITDARQAQKIIDDYTTKANSSASTAPVWDISSQIKEVQSTAKTYGVTITPPPQTKYSSQAQAQAALDSYITTTQKAMDKAWDNQPATAYDTLGRQQTVTNKQAQMMLNAQTKFGTPERYTYNVIPEEVANGGNNWWINDQGFYEWTPTTESDKAHLAEINQQRARNGVAPWTTLQLTAAHTDLYQKLVNDPRGSHAGKFVPTTSGELKIARMNAANPTNNSASASKSTANTSGKLAIIAAPKVSERTSITGQKAAITTPKTTTPVISAPKTTKELLEINSKTKQTVKATIISPSAAETRVENGHTIYTASPEYKQQLGREYDQKIAGTLTAPASSGKTGNPNYLKALEETKAEEAKQAEIRDAFAKNPLLDSSGKVINQITGKNGNEIISQNSVEHAKIITPIVLDGKTENYSRGGKESSVITQIAQRKLDTNPLTITGAGLSLADSRAYILSTPVTSATFRGVTPFRTTTDLALDEFRAQHPGIIGRTVATAYDATKDVSSLKKSLDAVNAGVATRTTQAALPSLDQFQTSRDRTLSGISVPGTGKTALEYHRKVQGAIQSNAVASGVQSFVEGEYTAIRDKPVSYAGELAAMYVGGAVLGGATKIATTGSRVGMIKAADKLAEAAPKIASKSQKVARFAEKGSSAILTGSKLVEPVVTTAFVGDIALNAIGQAKTGNWEGVAETGKSLLIGGAGYKKGAELAGKISKVKSADVQLLDTPSYKVSDIIPGVRTAQITEVAGSRRAEVSYGKTLTLGNKPLMTVVTTPGSRGISIGAAAAPESILAGKQYQPFSKLQTNLFRKTVAKRGGNTESSYLENALGMEKAITAMRKPLYTPESFEITSYAIPEAARPALIDGITSYKGDITVTGSVPMKAQAAGFVTRETHDLEIYGDNASAIATHLGESLAKKGLKAGKDYQINGSKIEFPMAKESGKEAAWDTGVEIFTHSGTPTVEPPKVKKTIKEGVESPEPKASDGATEIAFGYESRSPLQIDAGNGKKINTQQLAEQLTRKVAGSNFLGDGILKPEHPGRYKDIRDTITIGAAYGSKGKLPIERQVVEFTNAAYKKFDNIEEVHGLTGEMMRPFDVIKEDPVVDFIHKYQRLPTEAEISSENFVWKKNKNGKYNLEEKSTGKVVKTDVPKTEMEAVKKAAAGVRETRNELGNNAVLYSSEYSGMRSRSPSPARIISIDPARWLTSPKPSSMQNVNIRSIDPYTIRSRKPSPRLLSPKPPKGSLSPSPSPSKKSPSPSPARKSTSPSPSPSPSPNPFSSSPYTPYSPSPSPSPFGRSYTPSPISPSPKPSNGSYTPSPISPSPAPSRGSLIPSPSPSPGFISPSPSPGSPSPSPGSSSPFPSPGSHRTSPTSSSGSPFSRRSTGGWRQPPPPIRDRESPETPSKTPMLRVSKRKKSDKLLSTTKVSNFAQMLTGK